MTEITPEQVSALIEANRDIIDFGTRANAPTTEWIEKAEKRMRHPLTTSYKWYLSNYGGGEICGDEIYSIYGLEFETVNGGDIVFQHIKNLELGRTDQNKIEIMTTNFGELYYFDYTQFQNGECPIYLSHSWENPQLFARDFYEFLFKITQMYAQSAEAD